MSFYQTLKDIRHIGVCDFVRIYVQDVHYLHSHIFFIQFFEVAFEIGHDEHGEGSLLGQGIGHLIETDHKAKERLQVLHKDVCPIDDVMHACRY